MDTVKRIYLRTIRVIWEQTSKYINNKNKRERDRETLSYFPKIIVQTGLNLGFTMNYKF